MSKKTLGLITILLVLASVLVFVAISQKKSQQPLQTNNTQNLATSPTVVKVPPTSTLSFSPASMNVSSKPQQAQILIDTANDVTAIQIELTFDPQKITSVGVSQPTTGAFLDKPTELLKNVNAKTGRVTYAFGISPAQQPKKGSGVVAILSFTPNLNAGEKTTITFLPKTLVTALGFNESVLKSTNNLNLSGQ